MPFLAPLLPLFALLFLWASPLAAQQSKIDPAALAKLDQRVAKLVEEGDIVGGELLVLQAGKPVLRSAHGWRDQDAETAMQPGTVFCVRSMTKPLIGASILMLIEEGKLNLDDRIAQFIPAYDVAPTDQLTIHHMLTHTSGYPFSLMVGKALDEFEDIHAVAALGAGFELEFKPGSRFQYSDQNTDTMTAIIEHVTGASAVEFVQARILDPLGMDESTCMLTDGHPLRERASSKYIGGPGAWKRYWEPSLPSIFPCFLGSQGLYSTTADYAKFMSMWQAGGVTADGTRLLSGDSVKLALTSGGFPLGSPSSLPEARTGYGRQMQLWTRRGLESIANPELLAFGHTGSDGTHAWVFPQQDIQAYYFTQSRGTLSGLAVEEALGELVFGVAAAKLEQNANPDEYLGYYWEGENDRYRGIVRQGEGIALEILGEGVVELIYQGDDRWRFEPNPSVVLAFQRDDSGAISGYKIDDHEEFKFTPSAELPSLEEVAAGVREQHGIAALEQHGPLRIQGKIEMKRVGLDGEFRNTYAWPDRFRMEYDLGPEMERIAFDGNVATYATGSTEAEQLVGERAKAARVDHHLARFGDWAQWYGEHLEVVQRIQRGSNDLLLIRVGDFSAPGITLYIDMNTGRLVGQDQISNIEGLGRLGQKLRFDDFREVEAGSGIVLPYRSRLQYANPMLGMITSTVDSMSLGGEIDESAFTVTKVEAIQE